MAEQPFLHIDDDWKKQAQEEKRRLAEQEAERAAKAPAAPPAAPVAGPAPAAASPAPGRSRGGREAPPASFAAIVQSLWTQAMLYLGELAVPGNEPVVNLDMARHQFDLLTILEAKTQGNLDEEEKHLLDAALYETSSRFINVASQYI